MARPGVTETEVFNVCEKLHRQGVNPTVDRVLHELGGSKSTIAPKVKKWKEVHQGIPNDGAELPTHLLLSVKQLYSELKHQADERIKTVQAQTQADIDLAQREAGEAQKRIAELYSKLKERDKTIDSLESELKSLKQELLQEQQAHAKTQTKYDASKQRLADRSKETVRLNELLEQRQRNLDHYRDTLKQQREQERADFERQVTQAEHAYKAANLEGRRLQEMLNQTETTLSHLETERNQLNDQVNSLTNRIQQDQLRLEILDSQTKQWENQSRDADRELEKWKEKTLRLDAQAAVDRTLLRQIEKSNETSLSREIELMEENTALKTEKARIEGQMEQLQNLLNSKLFKE